MIKRKLELQIQNGLRLKVLLPSDVTSDYVAWMNDIAVTAYTEQSDFKHTRSSVLDFVKAKLASASEYLFGIWFNDLHIGNIKLGPINFRHSRAEISYIIGRKEFWGQGFATKAITRVVAFAFDDLLIEKLCAGVYSDNIGSCKALEKSGFQLEARRSRHIMLNGVRGESKEYVLFRHSDLF